MAEGLWRVARMNKTTAFLVLCLATGLVFLVAIIYNNGNGSRYHKELQQSAEALVRTVVEKYQRLENSITNSSSSSVVKTRVEPVTVVPPPADNDTRRILSMLDTLKYHLGLSGDKMNEDSKLSIQKVVSQLDKAVLNNGTDIDTWNQHPKTGPIDQVQVAKEHTHNDNTSKADELFKKVRVLCFIPSTDKDLPTKGKVVMETWGKRCNKLIFFTDKEVSGYPTVGLKVPDTGNYDLTKKIWASIKYLYENEVNNYDWFMKADTDTYVIVENLRYMLSSYSPEQPIFFGQHFQKFLKNGYMSGGAGYVTSREGLTRFGRDGIINNKCSIQGGVEDINVGKCFQNVDVLPGDSRDARNGTRFHCMIPPHVIHGNYPDWFKDYDKFGAKHGIDSLSDYAVTFHWVSKEDMYNLEYYVYHLRPYGILSGLQSLNFNSMKSTDTKA